MSITIAVDAMGGDHGLAVTLPASMEALKRYSDLHIHLVGQAPLIEEALKSYQYDADRLKVVHAEQVIEMEDKPSVALRNKRKSSMRIALNLVKEEQAQACVSAGNTGALMAVSKFVLKTLPGIDRPAICTTMPTMKGQVYMLDLGANIGSDGENLAQFAVMGEVLAKALDGNPEPRVGLLNIGEEEIKGHQRIKDANAILKRTQINYVGYAEGDDIFKGNFDVIACDGFDGNVALKASEGVAKMIAFYLKKAFNRNLLTKMIGLIAYPVLKSFKEEVDPRKYNGASLLGLRKIVIKSHGGTDVYGFRCAIEEARMEVIKDVPSLIASEVERILTPEVTVLDASDSEQKA